MSYTPPKSSFAALAVVALLYQGPFADQKNWQDEPLVDWKKSNATVHERGGWRTYLKDAQAKDPQTPAKGSANTVPAHSLGHKEKSQ